MRNSSSLGQRVLTWRRRRTSPFGFRSETVICLRWRSIPRNCIVDSPGLSRVAGGSWELGTSHAGSSLDSRKTYLFPSFIESDLSAPGILACAPRSRGPFLKESVKLSSISSGLVRSDSAWRNCLFFRPFELVASPSLGRWIVLLRDPSRLSSPREVAIVLY